MKGTLKAFFLIFMICAYSYAQDKSGLTYNISYTGDVLRNHSGGIGTGGSYLGLLNGVISFDPSGPGLWSGGELLIRIVNTHGGTPTADLIGDFQGASNIEAGNLTYLHELWYKHEIGRLFITAGLQDLSAEFAVSSQSALFLNSSFGVHSTLSDNVPSPIFPLTALGLLFNVEINNNFSFKIAAFDGLPDDFDSNPHNLKWDINSRDGIFTISEFNMNPELFGHRGTYKIGGYYHNHIMSEKQVFTDNYGVYLICDQVLKQYSDKRSIGLFTQMGISPAVKNDNHFYVGTGLTFRGIFPGRHNDLLGIAAAHASLRSRNDETVIELSYQAQITDYLSIQPDVQYIVNASGAEANLKNPLVGILRIGIGF